ncbi:MAG TPA: DUF5719 family protein [Actinomycetes bacterium]
MTRPAVSVVAVCGLLAVGLGAAAATGPEAPRTTRSSEVRSVPVARATGVCPDPATNTSMVSRAGVATPSGLATGGGTAGSGSLELGDLGGNGAPRVSLSSSPSSAVKPIPPHSAPLVATASGSLAPGFAASMVTRGVSGDLRGLSGTSCVAPGTDFWFVGAGAVVGQRGRLYLTNAESAAAVVDVTLFGPDGPIDTPAGRGIAVAAGAQEVRLLDALSPDTAWIAVHVQVHQGKVAAALRDQQVAGLEPRGTDWVPAAAAPARHVVVPGVPAGAGERRLQVLVPGDSDAIIRLRLIGRDGSFAPAGLDVLQAEAGSVTDVDLAPYAKGQDVAVDLTSDVPVAAGLLARVGPATGGPAELAYTAGTPALTPAQPGVAALAWFGSATHSTLALAAPGADAQVRVVPLPPATGQPVDVRVPAGTATVVDLATVTRETLYAVAVVPAPGSGPVVASRQISEVAPRGPLITVEPVQPGRFAVRVPSVSADLSTGLRPRR